MPKQNDAAYLAALESGVYDAALRILERAIPQLGKLLNGRWPSCMELDQSDPQQPVLLVILNGDSHRLPLMTGEQHG